MWNGRKERKGKLERENEYPMMNREYRMTKGRKEKRK
jgi:hypothetical protein